MAVKAACRSIGVHVHVVSGYELRGDTLRRTELRIAEAFKQAGTYGSIYESTHDPFCSKLRDSGRPRKGPSRTSRTELCEL